MLFIADYGSKAKRIGNFGIQKCLNCNNWTPQGIYEIAKQVRAFFIPVAKWDKEIYVACPICSAMFPPKKEHLEDLLRSSTKFPNDETAIEIWNLIDEIMARFALEEDCLEKGFWNKFKEKVITKGTAKGFQKEHVEFTLVAYVQSTLESKK